MNLLLGLKCYQCIEKEINETISEVEQNILDGVLGTVELFGFPLCNKGNFAKSNVVTAPKGTSCLIVEMKGNSL